MPITTPTTIVAGDLIGTQPRVTLDAARTWLNGGALTTDFDALDAIKLPRPSVWGFPRQECECETQFIKWHNSQPEANYWSSGVTARVHGAHQVVLGSSLTAANQQPLVHTYSRFTVSRYSRFVVSIGFTAALTLDATSTYGPAGGNNSAYVTLFYRYNDGTIVEVDGARRALHASNAGGQIPVRLNSGWLAPSAAGYVEVWAAVVAGPSTGFDQGSAGVVSRFDFTNATVLVEMFKDYTS